MKHLILIVFSCLIFNPLYGQYYKNLLGQPFSDEVLGSILYTSDGKKTNLKDVLDGLKGNIILIDFWASWCGTCIREMPYSKELQKEFKGKKVAFLFLSTDVDYKKWIRGLATVNIEGHHYRIDVDSKKAIKEFLKIRGIPYYVILDNQGNIYDPKAKWPHQEQLKNSIELLIKMESKKTP